MLGVMMAVWSLIIWPFVFRFTATLGTSCLLTGTVIIRTIGIKSQLEWRLIHSEDGPDIELHLSRKKNKSARNMNMKNPWNDKIQQALHSSPFLKKNLLRYLSQSFFYADIRLGFNDAAVTALACGTINALFGCLPHSKGKAIPDFQNETLCIEVRCISSFRLGKLLLSAALLLHAVLQQFLRRKYGGAIHG